MPNHKFRLGQTVYFRSRNVPSRSAYKVTKQLTGGGGELEYRLKSTAEVHERAAKESELSAE